MNTHCMQVIVRFFDYGCELTGDACKRHPREYEGEIQSECDQLIEFETLLKRGD